MQQLAPELGRPVELRVLTGPNLYFPRPAVKLTLDASAVLDAEPAAVVTWQRALRVRNPTVGLPDSPTRMNAAAELAAAVVRRAAGTLATRVAAVARPGDADTVVVAYPFRHRGTAEIFGLAVAHAFASITRYGVDSVVALGEIPAALAGHDPGDTVRPLRPAIPVVAVTGTNGKTTTTRLIAHLVKAGGRVPGWSSTDGIVIDGQEVESGDWSGPGGAARVLEDPRVQVAVTETARGGILLRGVGTATNDVSVVTNVSADHLGLLGVHTIEQLAEVKSVVVRITKASGWTVLNADDPLVQPCGWSRGRGRGSTPPTRRTRIWTRRWRPAGGPSRSPTARSWCSAAVTTRPGSPPSPTCPSPWPGRRGSTWPTCWRRPRRRWPSGCRWTRCGPVWPRSPAAPSRTRAG